MKRLIKIFKNHGKPVEKNHGIHGLSKLIYLKKFAQVMNKTKTMRKINVKLSMLAICAMVAVGGLTTSCSKDKNETEQAGKGDLNAMVGNYKGKVQVYQDLVGSGAQHEFFDAIVTVSKVGNNKIKISAKSGEAYSSITEKTIDAVTMPGSKNIASATGDVNGIFLFNGDTKSLNVVTQKQAATDIMFSFEGVKQ